MRTPFLSPFREFCSGGLASPWPPGSPAPCWYAVATVNPRGNCDSSEAEAHPDYLTRLGAASGTLLTAKLLVRSTGACDRARGAGESCLHASAVSRTRKRGRSHQPGTTFPRSPGIILETNPAALPPQPVASVLSMNHGYSTTVHGISKGILCTDLFTAASLVEEPGRRSTGLLAVRLRAREEVIHRTGRAGLRPQ